MNKDEEWIRKHFEELVDNYAGKFVAVSNEELFEGKSYKEAREAAMKKYPAVNPSIIQVPRAEDLICLL